MTGGVLHLWRYIMNNAQVIEVTPDKNGKVFITLYGTRYEIKVKEPKPTKTKDKE